MDRKKFSWDVGLADEQGGVTQYRFSSYWSPEKDFITDDLIGVSAAAQAFMEHGKKKFFAVSVVAV